jgi:uncharacterized membrane protein YbhN (UPF0104 family)
MNRRTAVRVVGVAISLVCLGYFALKAVAAWENAGTGFVSEGALPRFAVASVLIMVSYAAAALAWVAVLRCFGLRAPATSAAGIYLTAQFAKYAPGNVGHFVGRVALAIQRGYPASIIALAMTLELVLLFGIAALLSLPMLGMTVRKLQAAWQGVPVDELLIVGLSIALVVSVGIVFALRRWPLLARTGHWAASLKSAFNTPAALGWLCLAALSLAVCVWLTSFSLLALGNTLLQLRLPEIVIGVSLFSVAWIVGMLTPGVPAGLGVREAILVEGLTPLLGASQAVSSALLFRLLTTLADVAAFGVGLLLLKLTPYKPT